MVEDVELTDEEIPLFETLMTENVLSSYVKEHPEPTDENIRAFADQYKERGINEEILLLLIRNEYLSKMPYEDRPIADPSSTGN